MTRAYIEKTIYKIVDDLDVKELLESINTYINNWYILEEGDVPQPLKTADRQFLSKAKRITVLSIQKTTNNFAEIDDEDTPARRLLMNNPQEIFKEIQDESGYYVYVDLDKRKLMCEDENDLNMLSDFFDWKLVKPAENINDIAVYDDIPNGIATIVGSVNGYIRVLNVGGL